MAHDRFSGLGSRILQHNILESFMHVYHNKPIEIVNFHVGSGCICTVMLFLSFLVLPCIKGQQTLVLPTGSSALPQLR